MRKEQIFCDRCGEEIAPKNVRKWKRHGYEEVCPKCKYILNETYDPPYVLSKLNPKAYAKWQNQMNERRAVASNEEISQWLLNLYNAEADEDKNKIEEALRELTSRGVSNCVAWHAIESSHAYYSTKYDTEVDNL